MKARKRPSTPGSVGAAPGSGPAGGLGCAAGCAVPGALSAASSALRDAISLTKSKMTFFMASGVERSGSATAGAGFAAGRRAAGRSAAGLALRALSSSGVGGFSSPLSFAISAITFLASVTPGCASARLPSTLLSLIVRIVIIALLLIAYAPGPSGPSELIANFTLRLSDFTIAGRRSRIATGSLGRTTITVSMVALRSAPYQLATRIRGIALRSTAVRNITVTAPDVFCSTSRSTGEPSVRRTLKAGAFSPG